MSFVTSAVLGLVTQKGFSSVRIPKAFTNDVRLQYSLYY